MQVWTPAGIVDSGCGSVARGGLADVFGVDDSADPALVHGETSFQVSIPAPLLSAAATRLPGGGDTNLDR